MEKLDIDGWRDSLNESRTFDYITLEDYEGFIQSLDELEKTRDSLELANALIIELKQDIHMVEKSVLRARDDGYEKGWDDASRDGER